MYLLIGVFIMISCCSSSQSMASDILSKQKSIQENTPIQETGTEDNGKFYNQHIDYKTNWWDIWKVFKAYWRDDRKAATPTFDIPVITLTPTILASLEDDSIIKLGHSSSLLKLAGQYILIDPVFSVRASPFQWMGPKRFHASPISLDSLPLLAAVIISHDHYDHLDKGSIVKLKDKTDKFITPLKVGEHLRKWGVNATQIKELNWWDSVKVGDVTVIATPSQHFSGRGLFDRDKTLWASWVIQSLESKVFYSGDSGYFNGFKEIGEKYGPFDLSLIETGAYNEMWSEIHMHPNQSLQAHIDINAKVMMPVHNSTFDLALHDWNEPLIKIVALALQNDIAISTPIFGEPLPIRNADFAPNKTWWLEP